MGLARQIRAQTERLKGFYYNGTAGTTAFRRILSKNKQMYVAYSRAAARMNDPRAFSALGDMWLLLQKENRSQQRFHGPTIAMPPAPRGRGGLSGLGWLSGLGQEEYDEGYDMEPMDTMEAPMSLPAAAPMTPEEEQEEADGEAEGASTRSRLGLSARRRKRRGFFGRMMGGGMQRARRGMGRGQGGGMRRRRRPAGGQGGGMMRRGGQGMRRRRPGGGQGGQGGGGGKGGPFGRGGPFGGKVRKRIRKRIDKRRAKLARRAKKGGFGSRIAKGLLKLGDRIRRRRQRRKKRRARRRARRRR